MSAKANSLPRLKGGGGTLKPHARPIHRPSGEAAIEGQTVITVTSPSSGGATPAIACCIGMSNTTGNAREESESLPRSAEICQWAAKPTWPRRRGMAILAMLVWLIKEARLLQEAGLLSFLLFENR